jgi:glutamate synthase (NADPH/NADH) small chain
MGDPKGFMKIARKDGGYRPVSERIYDYGEVEQTLDEGDRRQQAARCMDCGVPFCHWGCPVGSKIPEWQDALYRGDYAQAYQVLHSTNPFPEFTGRVCPAPCEKACVLAIHEEAVTIRENECATVERAFDLGWILPAPPPVRSGRSVAIVGSGPAGLAAADLLNKAGHAVTVFEKSDAPGGLLRYGIPDFKLAKNVIDRRIDLFRKEGIHFRTGITIGQEISGKELLEGFDAVLLAVGAGKPRDLTVEGRDLKGIHQAMDYLTQQNKIVAGAEIPENERITARGKKVVVIGGGDTGSDCVGTAIRQKAESVTQIEILPQPPGKRGDGNPWPWWPQTLRTSSSHLEGCTRLWSLATRRFTGSEGQVTGIETIGTAWASDGNGRMTMKEIPGSEAFLEADMVLLAMGFTMPVHEGLLEELGVEYDARGNVKATPHKKTSLEKVFVAGDAERGASLVVYAIESGKNAASAMHEWLAQPGSENW